MPLGSRIWVTFPPADVLFRSPVMNLCYFDNNKRNQKTYNKANEEIKSAMKHIQAYEKNYLNFLRKAIT